MKKTDVFKSYRPAAWKDMQRWAQAGRPDRILKDMLEVRHFRDRPPSSELLWHAFDQASQHNTEYLAAASFHTAFSINYGMLARLQRLLEMYLRESDGYEPNLRVWGHVATDIFPLLTYVSRQTMQLTKEFAAAKRWLTLPDWEEILAAQEELARAKAPPPADAAPDGRPARRKAHRRPGRPDTSRDSEAPAPVLPPQAAAHPQSTDDTSASINKESHGE
jgi:hypothetical protein